MEITFCSEHSLSIVLTLAQDTTSFSRRSTEAFKALITRANPCLKLAEKFLHHKPETWPVLHFTLEFHFHFAVAQVCFKSCFNSVIFNKHCSQTSVNSLLPRWLSTIPYRETNIVLLTYQRNEVYQNRT